MDRCLAYDTIRFANTYAVETKPAELSLSNVADRVLQRIQTFTFVTGIRRSKRRQELMSKAIKPTYNYDTNAIRARMSTPCENESTTRTHSAKIKTVGKLPATYGVAHSYEFVSRA